MSSYVHVHWDCQDGLHVLIALQDSTSLTGRYVYTTTEQYTHSHPDNILVINSPWMAEARQKSLSQWAVFETTVLSK